MDRDEFIDKICEEHNVTKEFAEMALHGAVLLVDWLIKVIQKAIDCFTEMFNRVKEFISKLSSDLMPERNIK